MAHYAQIDDSNKVVQVIVIANDKEPTEAAGVAYCEQLTGQTGWIKTSYNANIRKNYAGIGHTYDPIRDAFIPPKPYPSWTLSESTCRWQAPTPEPETGGPWQWDEATLSWVGV